jgi:ribosomal protein L10
MAINAKIDLKKPVLEEISAQVEGAQCVLLVNYSGLTVAQDTQLRKELREAGVHYKVYKNTMMKRAFASSLLPKTWMAQTLSQSARTMQQLRQESSLNLQKPLRSWRWFLVL